MTTPGSHACHACLHLELLIMAAPSGVSTSPLSSGDSVSQDFCRVTVVDKDSHT